MNKVVVFDFDKTLTFKDTNLGFFKFAGREQPLFVLKLVLYLLFSLFRKLKIVSNTRLKNLGLFLFFSKKTEIDIYILSMGYSKIIKLNDSVYDILLRHRKEKNRVIIATASFTSYIKPIFPGIEVAGSEIDYTKTPIRLKTHCFSQKKVECLNLMGIDKIDILYTDSLSDLPMAEIANAINLVKKNEIVLCKSVKDFIIALEE